MASDFYSEIDSALVEYLQQRPELADVRTIEADIRDAVFEEAAAVRVKAFRVDELPAINVSVQVSPARSLPRTTTKLTYEIPLFVSIALRATTLAALREQARRLQREVEAALHLLRGVNTTLGPDCYVTGDLVSSPPVLAQDDNKVFVGVAVVETTIFKSVVRGA